MEKERSNKKGEIKLMNAIIAIVIAAAVFLGIAYMLLTNKSSTTKLPKTEIQVINTNISGNETSASLCDDDCLLKYALTTTNSSYCNNMSSERSDECWQIFSASDFNACLKLKNYEMRKNCIGDAAFSQKNTSLCNLLSEQDKIFCIEKINPPCLDIVDQAEREVCLALRNNDTEYCSNSKCLLDYAKERNDSKVCDMLKLDSEKSACISILKGTDECFKLSGIYTVDYCYQLFAQYSHDYSYCKSIETKLYKFNCYKSAAIDTRNKTYCEKNDLEYIWDCYTNYSLSTGDISGCLVIDSTYARGSRDGCLNMYANQLGDPTACNYPSTVYIRTNCYANSIMNSQNLSIEKCFGITNSDWRDKCFTSYAIKSSQKIICSYIENSDEKKRCEDSVNVK